jgi:CheY-like chemotaxis protein
VLATKAAHALALAASGPPDLVVLDLGLPDRDGTEVLASCAARPHDAGADPVGARRTEADKLEGFRLGADDYVTKPFSIRELLARVAVLLRRAAPAPPPRRRPRRRGARPPISDEELRERYGLTPRRSWWRGSSARGTAPRHRRAAGRHLQHRAQPRRPGAACRRPAVPGTSRAAPTRRCPAPQAAPPRHRSGE